MGGLMSTFGKGSLPQVFIDLNTVTPAEPKEQEIFDRFSSIVVKPASDIYNRFSQYKDGQTLASASIATPTQENKDKAWDAILPNVKIQMEVYNFASTITNEFVNLINVVTELTSNSSSNIFIEYPAVMKCFADCFDICIKFDTQVLYLPKLQNDLAFFRRSAHVRNNDGSLDDIIDDSNNSTVFWASQMPFVSNTIRALKDAHGSSPESLGKVLALLGNVSDVCVAILTNKEEISEALSILCLRCSIGAIIMYDHLSPTGSYSGAKFHVLEAIQELCIFEPKQTYLVNFIKYASKHYDAPNTDQKIKSLLEK